MYTQDSQIWELMFFSRFPRVLKVVCVECGLSDSFMEREEEEFIFVFFSVLSEIVHSEVK